ncbi:hypothetical protein HYFRA_00006715 [Hymenoscyphus fraxineus]|uniref:Heterokaryon incompatibility domain-containing protein n=1 Tax=Hymenoscyphus fraxineus TaxID=746836 RepID=A0A9N9KVW2_9HELO|nr:hypothetical protein HYFRA_00006715 [Hymenoscyphus fraxineus]
MSTNRIETSLPDAHSCVDENPQLGVDKTGSSTGEESEDTCSSRDESEDYDHVSVADEYDIQEDPVLGRWPRRLLHVDSMTSYEWEPGNIYGGYTAPRYNIISYTWGRYVLRVRKKPHVKAIQINNVTWEIPRIDDDAHFSVTDFLRMISNAGILNARQPSTDDCFNQRVDFVWLDIACIDQTNGSRVKGLEIGRQAMIFQHASSSFIWLSQIQLDELQLITCELREAAQQGPIPDMSRGAKHFKLMQTWLQKWIPIVLKHLKALLQEPWFTSLWTLQEAYLRPLSLLLCKDGRPIPRKREGFHGNENLRSVTLPIMEIVSHCHRSLALGCSHRKDVEKILELAEKLGAGPILRANPIALFQASTNRQTYDILDRIYGIMQIFGFRLGSADPSFPQEKLSQIGLSDLELLFSKELLKRYPVQSQLNVFTSVKAVGQAWRADPLSRIPSFARIASMYTFAHRGIQTVQIPEAHRIQPMCRLLPAISSHFEGGIKTRLSRYLSWMDFAYPRTIIWCEFSGIACDYSKLQQIWERVYTYTRTDPRNTTAKHAVAIHEIALDLRKKRLRPRLEIPFLPNFPLVGHEIELSQQKKVAYHISQAIKSQDIMVLALGTQKHPTLTLGRTNYGMIIVKKKWKQSPYWHRIGVVSWEVFDLPPDTNEGDRLLLKFRGNSWKKLTGRFG